MRCLRGGGRDSGFSLPALHIAFATYNAGRVVAGVATPTPSLREELPSHQCKGDEKEDGQDDRRRCRPAREADQQWGRDDQERKADRAR